MSELIDKEPVIKVSDSIFEIERLSMPGDQDSDPSGLFDAVHDGDTGSKVTDMDGMNEALAEKISLLKRTVKIMMSEDTDLTNEEFDWALNNHIPIDGVKKARHVAEKEKGRGERSLNILYESCREILEILENPSGIVYLFSKSKKLKSDMEKAEMIFEDILRKIDESDPSKIKSIARKWRSLPDKQAILERRSATAFSLIEAQQLNHIVGYLKRLLREAQLKQTEYSLKIDHIRQFVLKRLEQIRAIQRKEGADPEQLRLELSGKIRRSLPDL